MMVITVGTDWDTGHTDTHIQHMDIMDMVGPKNDSPESEEDYRYRIVIAGNFVL